MSLLQNSNAIPTAGATDFYDYKIASSLRNSASQNGTLKFTAGTPTSSDTFTMSCWVKRYTTSTDDAANNIFVTGTGGGTYLYISLGADLQIEGTGGNYSGTAEMKTNAAYRDTSAWYHFVFRFDSTQSTQTDRMRIYVNGSEPTYSVQDLQAQGQNTDWSFINQSGVVQAFGGLSGKGHGTEGADLQMADIIFCDGQSYGPDSFAETVNGVYKPVDPSSLTFGNNGYWLKMAAGAIGTDSSGNGNNFTVANFAAHDVLLDTPTSNLCTQNPIANPYGVTLSEGNLKTAGGWVKSTYGTISINSVGSWYWEYITDNFVYAFGGLQSIERTYYESGHTHNIDFAFVQAGEMRYDGSNEADLQTIGTGDIIGVWVNDGVIKIYKNNSLIHTYSQQLVAGRDYFPTTHGSSSTFLNYGGDSSFCGNKTSGSANASDANGHGDFYYDPKGLALCAQNTSILEAIDPAKTDDDHPAKLVKTVRYTGNDGTQTIAMGFKPDFLMLNLRGNVGGGYPPQVWDTTRGDDYYMYPSGNANSVTSGSDYVEFVSTGFKTDESWDGINHNGETYSAFGLRANGGTTSSNNNGSITSTVQVDPSGHFSIGTYTGESASRTVGHGLSSAPDCIVVKSTSGTTRNWAMYTRDRGANKVLYWNNTSTEDTSTVTWGNTHPTSTVFSIDDSSETGKSQNYIFYAFANCSNYIKSGVYKGNANATNSPIIYTGFRPEWLLIRYTGTGESWIVIENASMPYNGDRRNYRFGTSAESTGSTYEIDLLSNSFKPRTTWEGLNGNNYEFVYLAIGQPFKYGTAV